MSVRNRVRTLTRTTVCSSDPVVARRERNTGGPRPGRSISGATASVLAALLISTSVGVAFGAPVSGFDGTETIHDRKVHLEEKLIERIPAVPRLCLSADTTKRRIAVGDCKLFCELEGDGVPLVLLHGGPGATHHYFHAAFAQAGPFAKVIYYDQRGCGLSDYQKGSGYTLDQAVGDLENLRKALGAERWVVLGHSYGGLLAQCYTVKYPDHVAGLVLVGAVPATSAALDPTRQGDFLSDEERARIREIHRTPGISTAVAVYNAFLNGDWKRQQYYKSSPEKLSLTALYEWKHDEGFNAIMSDQMSTVDLRDAFDDCPLPTLLLEGKWALTWNTDKPEKLHKLHPHAKLVLFDASGHSPFDDEPQ